MVFSGAFTAAGAVVPEQTVSAWQQSEASSAGGHGGLAESPAADDADDADDAAGAAQAAPHMQGVTSERSGYQLGGITAPTATGTAGELAFTVTGPDGSPVTQFETSHEKQAHLIVVRADGTSYRHVHPVRDASGRWSIPWQWEAAGTYRIYADVVPTGAGEGLTLTRTVDVAGSFEPATLDVSATDDVDGFQVSLNGDLAAGSASTLTVSVTRDGRPVTTLQPYLGAYGHLVALRAGDLAYLHTHPEGAAPVPGEVSGPEVEFATTAPTPGRYHLYFDFQVEGQVHSAPFVLDTSGATATPTSTPAATPTGGSTAGDGHGGH